MFKFSTYNSLVECYTVLKDYYKENERKVPDIRVDCFKCFLNAYADDEEFISKAIWELERIKEKLYIGDKHIYDLNDR